ncbi:hypothetical protein ACJA3J_14925 [Halobacillus sp. SY10]|uniref:hypothetical protein n=1 Tax=Halobacillus sp. SY10 TaxID=3381356 RepID=UPI00387914A0
MHIENRRVIEVEWEGPYSLTTLKNEKALHNNETDYGIYQVYGRHPLYGGSVLLYIGKADMQTIGKRVLQEGWEYENDASSIRVFAGRFIGVKTPKEEEWSSEIDLAERLLIYVHKPAHNSKSLYTIPDIKLQNIHILNWGDHCDLLPEVSGYRWTSKLDGQEFDFYRYNTNQSEDYDKQEGMYDGKSDESYFISLLPQDAREITREVIHYIREQYNGQLVDLHGVRGGIAFKKRNARGYFAKVATSADRRCLILYFSSKSQAIGLDYHKEFVEKGFGKKRGQYEDKKYPNEAYIDLEKLQTVDDIAQYIDDAYRLRP